MSSPLQRYEEIPAFCKNKDCENFKCFELYDVEDVKKDDKGDYFICYECSYKIYLED